MLIKRLRKQHDGILAALAQAREMSEAAPRRLPALLRGLRKKLLDHLALENARLYPELKRYARTDEELAYTVQVFAKDTRELARSIRVFFDRRPGPSPDAAFIRELARVLGDIKHRVWKEENILFPEYAKLRRGRSR